MNKSRSGNRAIGVAKAAKTARDNRSRQLNPEHRTYRSSRGIQDPPSGSGYGTRAKTRKR